MARQAHLPARVKKARTLETEYLTFFVPPPAILRGDDEHYSLEQPSPFKWVPSETTYGVGPALVPALPNA